MRLQLDLLVTLVVVVASSTADSDEGRSATVTAGASWLERRTDVVDEVVHSLEDYDVTTINVTTNATPVSQGQLSTRMTGQTSSQTPNVDVSRQTETTKTLTTPTVTTNSSATSTGSADGQQASPRNSLSATEFTGRNNGEMAFIHDNSTGTYEPFVDKSASHSGTSEHGGPPADNDVQYYTDEADNNVGNTNGTDGAGEHDMDDIQEMVESKSIFVQQVFVVNGTVESDGISNSSLATISNDSSVAKNSSETKIQNEMLWPSSTSTASPPLSTAWLLAELPTDPDWTNEVQSSAGVEYVETQRESPSSHVATYSARFGGPHHWRLFQRLQSRPARRRSGYRQILASPFVAGGRAMSERERKRALLQAFLLSGITGKDPSHRRALSAAVFYRSKLAKPPAVHQELGAASQRTNAELSAWKLPTVDVSTSPRSGDRADVTISWIESLHNSSSALTLNNSSSSMNNSVDSWTSADNATSNLTFNEGLVSAVGLQLHHTSADNPAAAAVVIPIIVGFLESLTRKQFSWLDMTLAVCGTVAAVLGLINLVVFIVHLLRTKRGKLSFHAERQLTSSSSPSSMSASRSSSDSTPPPPPPPPPLPLTGFGGLSRSSREISRDVLADDETLRIRPLTFKRPLNDWGFASSHALTTTTEAGAVSGQGVGVTVKSTGSDASSSGIESAGGRSDADSSTRAVENSGNMAVGNSVITNYAYCGNGGINRGIIIDVDDYRDGTYTSPSDFVFGKNYGDLDTKNSKTTTLTMLRPVTPTDDMVDRKQRERSRKTQAKHRGRPAAHVGRLDASLGGGLLSRPWKRLFGVSTDVSLPR